MAENRTFIELRHFRSIGDKSRVLRRCPALRSIAEAGLVSQRRRTSQDFHRENAAKRRLEVALVPRESLSPPRLVLNNDKSHPEAGESLPSVSKANVR